MGSALRLEASRGGLRAGAGAWMAGFQATRRSPMSNSGLHLLIAALRSRQQKDRVEALKLVTRELETGAILLRSVPTQFS